MVYILMINIDLPALVPLPSSAFTPISIALSVEFPLKGTGGTTPGLDIPKSLKMVLAAPRLALRFTG